MSDIAKFIPFGQEDDDNNGFVDKRKYNGSKEGIKKALAAKRAKKVEEIEIISESDASDEESDEDVYELPKPPKKPAARARRAPAKKSRAKSAPQIQDFQEVSAPYTINKELQEIKSIVADLRKAKKKPKEKKTVIQVSAPQQALPQPPLKRQQASGIDDITSALKNRCLLNF